MKDWQEHILLARKQLLPIDIVRTLKSITAIELFRQYPKLKTFYGRRGSLWTASTFISTIGNVSAETIKEYIEEQKGK